MDSKLLFWRKGTVRSEAMQAHAGAPLRLPRLPRPRQGLSCACLAGPVSAARMVPGTAALVSASYDKSLAAWSVAGGRPRLLARLGAMAAPVMEVRALPHAGGLAVCL